MKLNWKEKSFQLSFIVSNDWWVRKPCVKKLDLFTTLTDRSLPDLSDATSDMDDPSIPVNPESFLEKIGCITFWPFENANCATLKLLSNAMKIQTIHH